MFIQQDQTVPGLADARSVQAEIKRLGIQDVELFWDGEIGVWCVVQVRRTNTGIVTMDDLSGSKAEPYLLFYCKNEIGGYRPPNSSDVQSVVAIVRESHHWWQKGGDAFADEAEARDAKRRHEKEAKQQERVKPHLKALKRAIREELG